MIIYSDTGMHKDKKRQKHGYSDIHIHAILAVIYAFTKTTERNIDRNANKGTKLYTNDQ